MELMGRGFRQIMQESPLYFQILLKFAGYKLFNRRSPLYGSADIINVCNLHCDHCYWWLNRKENEELTVKQWKKIIDEKFKKQHVFIVTLVGGEPMMRPEVVELFVKEFPKRACVEKNGEKAWKDIWITMTINSRNYMTVKQVIEEWYDYSNKIGFQFHTPFMKGDPLWLPFGEIRSKVVDDIITMQENGYKDYIINPKSQLEIMKKSWGGKGTTPIDCPTWAILSVDHLGREKSPCCIGSAENNSMKPRCEECGLGCYSVLIGYGMKG